MSAFWTRGRDSRAESENAAAADEITSELQEALKS